MIIEKVDGMDEVTIDIESKEKVGEEEAKKIAEEIEKQIKIATTLRANVEILPPDSLPKSEGKVKRVIDKRK